MRMQKEWRYAVAGVGVEAETSIHLGQQIAHRERQQIQNVSGCPQQEVKSALDRR